MDLRDPMTCETVKAIKRKARLSARKAECCLTCHHSYFLDMQETGMCSHPDLTKGPHPKYVTDFDKCPLWTRKKEKK